MDASLQTTSRNSILSKEATINGERIATIQNLISVYERRLNRFEEEKKILGELIQEQYNLITKLGITMENIALTPDSIIEKPQQNLPNEKTNEIEYDNSDHFYSHINPDEFLQSLKNKIKNSISDPKNPMNVKFNHLFKKFPFLESAFFDKHYQAKIDHILEYVQTINSEQRKNFYNEIWQSLNNLPYYLSILFSLLGADSFQSLTETIETIIAQSLNYTRVVLYYYDSKKSVLTIEKQKLKMHHHLIDGVISNAIKGNKSIYIKSSDENLKSDDKSILVKHKEALFIPIEELGLIIGFFDKIGHFTELDDLLAHSVTSIISEIGQIFQLKKRVTDRISNYQSICDVFLQLSSTKDINHFLKIFSKGLSKCFCCDYAQLFKVSQNSRCYWNLNNSKSSLEESDSSVKKSTPFPIGFGIVGYSILKKTLFTFTQAERSVLFRSESDRPEPNVHVHSILVCPITDEKGDVKYAIVLYNKSHSDSFLEEDKASIGILAQHFNQIILSVINTSDLANEMSVSNRAIDDMNNLVNFVSFVPDLNSIENIQSNIPILMKDVLKIEQIDIYRIDRNLNQIYWGNEFYLNINSNNPIVKFTLENQIKEEKIGPNESKIFVPLIGIKSNTIGIMVLTTTNNDDDTISKSAYFSSNMSGFSHQNSNLMKKFNDRKNSKHESVFTFISNNRSKKCLSLWSQMIGKFVELLIENDEIKRLILLEERLLQSLNILDKKTIRYLYQQIKYCLSNKSADANTTTPLNYINSNDDVLENYISLLSKLNGFPQNHQLFTFSIENKFNHEIDESEIIPFELFDNEFPSSFNFNSFEIDENKIVNSLLCSLRDLGLISFFNFDAEQFKTCVNFIRSHHRPKPFQNWNLSIDRIQFLTFFLKNTNLIDRFSSCQKAALFFYLLSINCIQLKSEQYYLENGSSLNIGTIVFEALSSVYNCSFFSLDEEDQSMFFSAIQNLELINEVDCSVKCDLFVLTGVICSYSYLFRKEEIARKWIECRFEELDIKDKSALDDFIKFQLEFEVSTLIQPAFNEFTKQNYQIEKILKRIVSNLNKLYSITL